MRRLTLAVAFMLLTASVAVAQTGVPEGAAGQLPAPAAVGTAKPDAKAPTASELEQLRGELLRAKDEAFQLRLESAKLRAAAADLRAAYDTVTLTAERQSVERDKAAYVEKMRALLKPGKDDVFDWATLVFKSKPKEGGE